MSFFLNQVLQRLKKPETEFDRAMSGEMLTNEIRRIVLVLGLLVFILLFFLGLRFLLPEYLINQGANVSEITYGVEAVGILVIYELIVLRMLFVLRRAGREPPVIARYTNAFFETSLPTVVTFMFAAMTSPEEALFSPPSYAYFLFILLSTLRLNFALPMFTGIVAAAGYGLLVVLYWNDITNSSVTLFKALPVHLAKINFFLFGGVIAGLVARGIRKSFERSLRSIEERNHIREVFGTHVSPEVVDKLMSQRGESESETRHICVMFLDIRDFTGFAENRTPEEVVRYLNTLFDFMIDIINDHRGIVNKFLGDGFMAVFGAPLSDGVDSQNALSAAQAIIAEVNRRSAAGEIPPTRVGIGLHAGDAVTGNVGSRRRREYTIIGDTVNVASRIETLNKQFSSQLLISDMVRAAVESGGHRLPDHQLMEPIQVKGRAEPVQVYRIA